MRRIRPLSILAVCGLLVACASKPVGPTEADLAGSWSNPDGVLISLEETGVMVVNLPAPRPKAIVGQWSLSDGVATIRYLPESRTCVDDVGQYRIDASSDRFTASMVRESCDQRRKSFEGTWTRTAAARPASPG